MVATPTRPRVVEPRSRTLDRAARGRALSAVWRLTLASVAAYLALTAAVTVKALLLDDGHLVYTLDDPYINLALARTWLSAHTIGIWPGDFAPATSSLLWTALVTLCAAVVGLHQALPFVLDVASCLLLLWLFWWGSVGVGSGPAAPAPRPVAWWWYGAAALLPLVGHLPGLTLSGLEHPLHAALTIAYTVALFRVTQRAASPWRSGLYLLALLLPLVRLEGAFAVGVGALVLLGRRRVWPALGTLAVGALPTVALGVYSLRHGGMFLANSIVVKAVPAANLQGWWNHLVAQFQMNVTIDPSLRAVIFVAAIWLYFGWRARRRAAIEEAFYFLGLTALHLLFGDTGSFDRYEAYLIILALFFFVRHTWPRSIANPLAMLRKEAALGAGLACFVLFGFGWNKVQDYLATPLATNNIYEQQYQMARFIAEYYPHGAIVANDVGLTSYRAGGPFTDLAGLGTTEIARLVRRPGGRMSLTPDEIEPILQRNGADVIVIYPDWFAPTLYLDWYPVASWTIGKQQVTPAFTTVTFFAHTASQFPTLHARLRAYQPQLPADVKVQYYAGPS